LVTINHRRSSGVDADLKGITTQPDPLGSTLFDPALAYSALRTTVRELCVEQ